MEEYFRIINDLKFVDMSPKYTVPFGKSYTFNYVKRLCYKEDDLLIVERWDKYANVYDHVIGDLCIAQLAGANIEFLREAKKVNLDPNGYDIKLRILNKLRNRKCQKKV